MLGAACLVGLGACGEQVAGASFKQLASGAPLVDLDAAGHVREVSDTTEPTDTSIGGETTVTDTSIATETGDTDVPDTVDTGDTADTGDTGDITDTTDTTPVPCNTPNDCPEAGSCATSRCNDHVCVTEPRSCNDHDNCTDDHCDEGVGCVFDARVCPDPENPCEVGACDQQAGCVALIRQNNSACDDDPCKTGKTCFAGSCVAGQPIDCDDGDSCTSDACTAADGCTHAPIDGCTVSAACADLSPGAACDDGNASTSGDLCLSGICHGFTLTRVPGSTVAGQEGLVITETHYGDASGWTSIFWVVSSLIDFKWVLAKTDQTTTPSVYSTTLQGGSYEGLQSDGFVGDENGRIWTFDGGAWSKNNAWDTAVGQAKTSQGDPVSRPDINALFTLRDTAGQGVQGKRRLWVLGEDNWSESILACGDGDGGVKCSVQELDDFDGSSIPRAVTGLPKCGQTGACAGAFLITAADAPSPGDENYTDTYENANGAGQIWTQGSVPENSGQRASKDIATWGPRDAPEFLVIGTNSYAVHRDANGQWSDLYVIDHDPLYRDFTGAWSGSGIIALSATAQRDDGTYDYELWTCPTDADVEDFTRWTKHVLGNGPAVDAAGLYDVQGRANGELRAVGAIRRVGGVTDWLDGAVFVRTP